MSAPERAERGARPDIPIRDVDFELEGDIPRWWHGGRRAVTIFFDNLSTLFPLGEDFFIRSVRAYVQEVDDAELLREIRAFSGQEGIHTREHLAYNEMLKRNGHDVEALEEGIRRLLAIPELTGPMKDAVSLAATMALEHWTAMLAHFVLSDDAVLEGADPVMAGLWRWHAAEECEHKAVAYDVYERVVNHQGLRIGLFLLATALFWVRVVQQQRRMMAEAGIAGDLSEWMDLGRFLLVEQRVVQRLAPIALMYLRPDFHPWHIEDSHLIARWLDDYEQNPVYRKRIRKTPTVLPKQA